MDWERLSAAALLYLLLPIPVSLIVSLAIFSIDVFGMRTAAAFATVLSSFYPAAVFLRRRNRERRFTAHVEAIFAIFAYLETAVFLFLLWVMLGGANIATYVGV